MTDTRERAVEVAELRRSGMLQQEIGDRYGVSSGAIRRWLRNEGFDGDGFPTDGGDVEDTGVALAVRVESTPETIESGELYRIDGVDGRFRAMRPIENGDGDVTGWWFYTELMNESGQGWHAFETGRVRI